MALAAVVVDGFAMKEHRGQFDSEAQGVYADYFFFRGCHFQDVAWGHVESVIKFDEPVQVSYGQGRSSNERYLGDMFNMVRRGKLYDDLLNMVVQYEERRCAFGEVLHDLQAAGVRCFSEAMSGMRSRARQGLFGLHLIDEMLNLVVNSCVHDVVVPLQPGTKFCCAAEFLGVRVWKPEGGEGDAVSLAPTKIELSPSLFKAAADIIRGVHHCDPDDLDAISQEQVLAWLDAMRVHAAGGMEHLIRMTRWKQEGRKRYEMEYLVMIVRLADVLRNDGQIREALDTAGRLFGLPAQWLSDDAQLPAKSTLSKYRFILDAAHALQWREWLRNALQHGGLKVFLLCDSSPRAGVEWIYIEVYIIKSTDVVAFSKAMREIIRLRSLPGDHRDKIRALSAQMEKLLIHHILIPCGLGARYCSLAHKWAALLHSVRIEAYDWAMVSNFMGSVINITSDMGTEATLKDVPSIDPNVMFPGWEECRLEEEQTLDPDSPLPSSSPRRVDLRRAMRIIGEEHVLHTIQRHIFDKCTGFKAWYQKGREVARLLGRQFYRKLIIKEFLSTPDMRWLAELLEAGIPEPYEGRFGTIMCFLEAVIPCEDIVRVFKPHVFNRKQEDDGEVFVDVGKACSAILDAGWWSYSKGLLCLGAGLHELRSYCRGCRCHRLSDLSDVVDGSSSTSYYLRRRAYTLDSGNRHPCVARGMLAPEFACGANDEILTSALRIYRRKLWNDIKGVDRSARDAVMSMFDLGSQHLEYLSAVKHACWKVLPLRLLGTAHYDEAKARTAAVDSVSQIQRAHDRPHDMYIADLLIGDGEETTFMTELVQFSQGARRDDLAVFDAQASEFEMMRVNELSIERLHAQGSQEVMRGKNLSAASQSFALRRKQIFCLTDTQEPDLLGLSDACKGLAGVDCLIKKFNLEQHPEIKEFMTRRTARGKDCKLFHVSHKLIRQIFYHIDSWSMYNVQGELQAAIDEQRQGDAAERSSRAEDPLSHARSDDAPAEVKVEALHLKLAFEHFKVADTLTFLDTFTFFNKIKRE